MEKKKWYHCSSIQGTIIASYDTRPGTNDTEFWYGPFNTFGEVKQDALMYHRGTKSDAEMNIKEVLSMKKSDLK